MNFPFCRIKKGILWVQRATAQGRVMLVFGYKYFVAHFWNVYYVQSNRVENFNEHQ